MTKLLDWDANPLGWDDWNCPPPLYEAIGRVAAANALLDQMLRDVVAGLLGTDLGRVAASGDSTAGLIDVCQRLIAYRDNLADDDVEALLEVLRKARDLNDQRSQVMHATWLSHTGLEKGERLARRSRRRTPTHTQSPWSATRVRGVADGMRALVVELEQLWFNMFYREYSEDRRAEMLGEPRRPKG